MKAPDYHVRGSDLGSVCDFLTRLKAESWQSFATVVLGQKAVLRYLWLWEGNLFCLYLLSNHIGVMTGLHFEGAIVCP